MPSTVSADIPIIDLAGDQKDVSKQLVEAAAEHGFIYIRNLGHDIPAASVDDAFRLVREPICSWNGSRNLQDDC